MELEENIGKGINKEHTDKVLKARSKDDVCQVRCTTSEKLAFQNKVGKKNVSMVTRILWDKLVKGKIEWEI